MNRKGFMRVVEATLAVVIILGVLVVVSSRQIVSEQKDLGEIIPSLLDEVAKNETLRESIINNQRDQGKTEKNHRSISKISEKQRKHSLL